MRGGFLFLLFALCATAQTAPRRLALLLGNSAYQHLPQLTDVKAEMAAMRSALEDAGFQVTVVENATQERLGTDTVPKFLGRIKPDDVCFFYYSGYAMQAQQDNYLLSVEYNPADPQAINLNGTSLTGFQQLLDDTKAGLKILALEASRSNANLMTQGIGLANPDVGASREILFAFAAAPNQFAPGNDGTFTKYLAAAIRKKGLVLDEVFRDVYRESSAATEGKQQTFFQSFVRQDFFFHKVEKPPDPPPVIKPPVVITPVEKPVIVSSGKLTGFPAINRRDREEYVWIPGGAFKMGCVPDDTRCKPEEKPQHTVKITQGFWMGRNEVQVGSFQRYVDEDKKTRKMPVRRPDWDKNWKLTNYPIVEVTWDDARQYCEWAGGRLPTEAEWEYAARGGKSDEMNPANDANSREKANFEGTKGNDRWEQAAPVRSFDPNPYNLFDMAGNVWEWCMDGFSKDYVQSSPGVDPPGPAGLSQHVVRGGSWYSDPKQHLRISYRDTRQAGNTVGFRCILPDNSKTDGLLKSQ